MADTGFTRPTLDELIAAVSEDMRSSLAGAAPYVPRSVLWIAARVVAGAAHVVYGALDYAARQIFAHTADEAGVLAHAAEWGVPRIAATKAAGSMQFAGTPGTSIASGTQVARQDGWLYVTTASGTVGGGGSVTIAAESVLAGAAGNAADGDGTTYQLASPIVGVDTAVAIDADLAGGSDEEEIEDLRARVLARKADPPQGGAAADYEAWALLYGPAVKAWVVPSYIGAGSVGVYFVVEGTGAAILPDSADVSAVQGLLDTRRPVTADADAVAPSAVTVTPTISISPDTAANRATISDALERLMLRRAGSSIQLSDLWQAIGEADLDTYLLTSPTAAVTVATGQCAVLGTITWA